MTYIMLWIDSSSFDTKKKYNILSKKMRNTKSIIKHEGLSIIHGMSQSLGTIPF